MAHVGRDEHRPDTLTTAQDVQRVAGLLATGRPTPQPAGSQVEEAFDELIEKAGLAATYPASQRPREDSEDEQGARRQRKACAVSFHDLRSTLLTQLGDLGVDETTRARIAGHGPKNVTQRYDPSTLKRMRAALEAFEELVFTALEQGGGER